MKYGFPYFIFMKPLLFGRRIQVSEIISDPSVMDSDAVKEIGKSNFLYARIRDMWATNASQHGDQLPGIRLYKTYGYPFAKKTVSDVYIALEEDGVLKTTKGGTFINKPPVIVK